MLRSRFFCVFSIPVILLTFSHANHSEQKRIRPVPQFLAGVALRYNIETRTSSNEHTTTPVVNKEGASQYKQSTSLVLRLDVLGRQLDSRENSNGVVRFRATFEQVRSDSEADAYAPEAAAIDDAIEKLEGQSFEFAMMPDKSLADVHGLEQLTANGDVAARVLSWVRVLSAPVELPQNGIEIGQKWSVEHPLNELPLTGIVWRNEFSYLRDEPCSASANAKNRPVIPTAQGDCAILLAHFEILRHGSAHSDATPEDYLRNGLRTSGKWTGTGESLEAISLSNGFLVSSTQTGTQDMDYEISSAASGSRIHHVGQTTTQTEIALLASAAQ